MNPKRILSILAVMAVAAGTALPLRAHDEKHDKKADKAEASDKKAKAYPLDKCVVTDEKLGDHGKPYVFTHKGQEVKLCCKDCLKDFNKDSAKYIKKIDDAAAKK